MKSSVDPATKSQRFLDIVGYMLGCETCSSTWKQLEQRFDAIQDNLAATADRLINALIPVFPGKHLFLQGTVCGGVATSGSDIDIAFTSSVENMEPFKNAVAKVLRQKGLGYSNMYKTSSQVRLIHFKITNGMQGAPYSVDICSNVANSKFALSVRLLPRRERMIIVAAKLFMDKLKLINVQQKRLSSSFFAIAYLCFKHDPQQSSVEPKFSTFAHYIAEFDFKSLKMTDKGPEPKGIDDPSINAIDTNVRGFTDRTNVLCRTNESYLVVCQRWMKLAADVPNFDHHILQLL